MNLAQSHLCSRCRSQKSNVNSFKTSRTPNPQSILSAEAALAQLAEDRRRKRSQDGDTCQASNSRQSIWELMIFRI